MESDRREPIQSHLRNPLPRALLLNFYSYTTTVLVWIGLDEMLGEKLKNTPTPKSSSFYLLTITTSLPSPRIFLFRCRTCLPVGPAVDWATRSAFKQVWVHHELSRTHQALTQHFKLSPYLVAKFKILKLHIMKKIHEKFCMHLEKKISHRKKNATCTTRR